LPYSPTNAKQSLADFSSGLKNILVTTTVAEEGMDIPEANCVIRFDPLQTGVSMVQGRGRARQEDSSHIITAQRSDRPIQTFENVENIQAELCSTFVPSKSSKALLEEEAKAQRNREINAAKSLRSGSGSGGSGGGGQPLALAKLNEFVKKTKATLEETCGNGEFIMVYSSCVREVQASVTGNLVTNKEKKAAKQEVAQKLVQSLLKEI
jgi:superfamily II DNA/RNA helicase